MKNMNSISEYEIVLRLCLGFVAGGVIGFERSSRRQVAGLRTHILIALGATCLMLLSILLPRQFNINSDPGRIAAQVVSGMGFLGAGAIIRLGNNIKGLTTAASLWLTAAIGMTIGAGLYTIALTTEILALVALVLLNQAERKIFPERRLKLLEVIYNHSDEPDTNNALEILKNYNIENQSMNVELGNKQGKSTRVSFLAGIIDTTNISDLAKTLTSCADISRVEIKEKF
jgi:putative Mg2+ transporter-C (MgtC) family protein